MSDLLYITRQGQGKYEAEQEYKEKIMDWMDCLQNAADYLKEHDYSVAAQEQVVKDGRYYIDLESPENDRTGADWIRLQAGSCYLFLHASEDGLYNGDRWYQYDPFHLYGEEVIQTDTYEAFKEELQALDCISKYMDLDDDYPDYPSEDEKEDR